MIKYFLLQLTILLSLLFAGACPPPLNGNAELDKNVGQGTVAGAVIRSEGGLAAIRELSEGRITFWLQSPVQTISIDLSGSMIAGWTFVLLNAMPGTALQNPAGVISYSETQDRTEYSIEIDLAPKTSCSLTFAPIDFQTNDSFSFVMMADVQGAITQVGDIYHKINRDSSLRFVAFAGDLTENMDKEYKSEYTNFIDKMKLLSIPIYSTPGNHNMGSNGPEFWHELFGRVNVHFTFKGVAFTLIDSSGATIEPEVYEWLKD